VNSSLAKWKSINFLAAALLLQFAAFVTIIFDLPVSRQVICFVYFTFIPGFVLLKILKLDNLDVVEIILFSVGFSVAFLMLAGLLVNEFSLLFGISQPLSLVPLMTVLNIIIFVGMILVYLKREHVKIWKSGFSEKSPLVLLFLCLPILSIVGAMYVNTYGNNLLLLFTIIAIAVLFIVGVLSKKLLPSKLYPFAVLMIAIAILYHSSLISNYIVTFGSDVHGEYFLFKTTQNNAHWSSTLPFSSSRILGSYNNMLSITILPTVYANILNINSEWVFKMLYPLIFSFVALGLYQIWQTYVGKKYAFISAFLLMAQLTFYTEMLGLNRQIIAELFFVLLLLIIVNKKIKPVNKTIFFMIFSFALVTSHYALAAIFLFFISFTLVSLIALKRPNRKITVPMVVFFFAVMFTWYIYTSGAVTFDSFVEVGNSIYRQLGDFLNPASRGETVLRGLGMVESPSIWNTISRIFAYLTQIFIVFGFVGLVTKRVRIHIEKEYFIFSLTAMMFLAALILVPGLANTLNMTRFYHILLFFLAPLCVIGVVFIVKLLSKRERQLAVSALVLIVLVPYFLFQTNFVYEVTGSESWSIPLSGYRMDPLQLYGKYGYTDAYSVYGAQWLSKNVDVENAAFYSDYSANIFVLTAYGMIAGGKHSLSNATVVADNGFVYLGTLNVVYGVVPSGELSWNTSELSFIFDDLNLVYTNGGCEVYRNKP
jgi:uncharacterized membrane protein